MERQPERQARFTTASGIDVERLYTSDDVPAEEGGMPGEHPFTRGIYPTMYRGRLWTMRQFAGFGSAAETNERYRALLAAGGTGLSVAFDLPTLMGRDPDHDLSLGEIGKCGVSVASVADMEELFERKGPRGGKTYSSACWCVLWRIPRKEFEAGWGSDKSPDRGAGNKAVMVEIVRRNERPGLLAYLDGTAVGWCAVDQYSPLSTSRRSWNLNVSASP